MEAMYIVDQCIEFLSLLPSFRKNHKKGNRQGRELKDIARFFHSCLQNRRYANILKTGLKIDLMSTPDFTDRNVVGALLNLAHRKGDRFLSANMTFLKDSDNRSVRISVYRMLLKHLATQLISILRLDKPYSLVESPERLRDKIELHVLEDYKMLGLKEIPPIKIRGRQGGELILEGGKIDDEIQRLLSCLGSGGTQWRPLATLDVSVREEQTNPFLDYYISVADTCKFNRSQPARGETVVLSQKPKTAALCFDRVWAPSEKIVPNPIRCWCGTTAEYGMIMNSASIYQKWLEQKKEQKVEMGEKTNEIGDDFKRRLYECVARHAKETSYELEYMGSVDLEKNLDKCFAEQFRSTAVAFSRTYTTAMVPMYNSSAERDKAYYKGDRAAILSSLSNLQIVDENCLTWDQVLDFRSDKENKRKYKRLLHWFDKEMVGKSIGFAEEEISQKLEDYERALKKHGIRTVVGSIEEVLDGKYLLGASGIGGGFALAGQPVLGMLAAGLFIGGKVAVKLIQTKFDFEDAERGPNSEISWVYETKKLCK